MNGTSKIASGLLVFALFLPLPVAAQHADLVPSAEDVKDAVQEPSYSPYAGRAFPTELLWVDTHLHTSNSLDARALGATLGPDQAYRLARGEEVTSATGIRVKLSRPLDFLVVADHSDAMGAMNEIVAGNPALLKDAKVREWYQMIQRGGDSAYEATMDVIATFSQGKTPEVLMDHDFTMSVWERYLETAEEFNDQGTFTALIG